MPKQKKDTDPSARIPTPSIDLDDSSAEDASPIREPTANRGINEPSDERTNEPSDDRTSEPSSGRSDEPTNQQLGEPQNQRTGEPQNQRTGEPQNRRTTEPPNRGTAEGQSDPRSRDSAAPPSSVDPSPADGFSDAPLTYESMITPTAPINRKKIGVHIDEVTFDASSEAWREMLRIDNNLNKGVVVEAALRVALADFAEKGSDSSLWKMVEQICRTEA